MVLFCVVTSEYSISQEICTRVFALLCLVMVIHWLIFLYPSGLLHWHCGNLAIAPVPEKQPWWIWINTSCEFIMNDCITTTKQSTTKPCAYFLGYTVCINGNLCYYSVKEWFEIEIFSCFMGPLLLTWININPNMDKWLHPFRIIYPFINFNGATVEVWE